MKANLGDWVRIQKIVLETDKRSENLPQNTRKVPLEMWDKGILLDETATIGDWVNIETIIGRKIRGKLVEINPYYKHNYGNFIPQLLYIGKEARRVLREGYTDEK